MSSDMMIICKEDGSSFEGSTDKAFFITECSMGEPWDEFGLFVSRLLCGAPSIVEQMHGVTDHYYNELTSGFAQQIVTALESMDTHKDLDKSGLTEYINSHVGMHLSTENW